MRKFLGMTLLVAMLAIAGCGAPAAAPAATAPATEAAATQVATEAAATQAATEAAATQAATQAAAATGGAVAACATTPAALSGKLNMAGSSALLPLMQLAATNFQTANKDVQIAVTAGGSGAGRSQVCQGKVDIGNSDVPLSDKEITDLSCGTAVQTPVAIQAFGAVANKQGPGSVTNLTKEQLQGIFSGTITNWKDVGGDDQQVVLINRAKGSGTRKNMANYLFAGDDTKFATGASEEDNNETVLQTVTQTPGAVSYLGFAYLNNPDLVAFNIDGVAPTSADIQNGTWPIAAPGYSITKQAPTELQQAFLCYVISPAFQNSPEFAALGFVPIVDAAGALTKPIIAPAQ